MNLLILYCLSILLSIFSQKAEKLIEVLKENVLLQMEGSVMFTLIVLDNPSGLIVTSSMITSHEHVFVMSKGDTYKNFFSARALRITLNNQLSLHYTTSSPTYIKFTVSISLLSILNPYKICNDTTKDTSIPNYHITSSNFHQ